MSGSVGVNVGGRGISEMSSCAVVCVVNILGIATFEVSPAENQPKSALYARVYKVRE